MVVPFREARVLTSLLHSNSFSHLLRVYMHTRTRAMLPEQTTEAIDDDLIDEIIAATDRGPSNHDYGVGGHEAFTSIVFAPKVLDTPS